MSTNTNAPYVCPYCKKTKLYKINFQKHLLLCEHRHTVAKTYRNTACSDNVEQTTTAELLLIITKQDEQIQRMAKQVSQINQLLNRQERRNICDHLNKTIPRPNPYIPFTEWFTNIEITFPFILSMCQYDIRDTLLERFKQYYYETAPIHPIPIKAFVENRSKVYLYDTEQGFCTPISHQHHHHTTQTHPPSPPPPHTPKWVAFQNEPFVYIAQTIYKKWKRTFAKWMIENEDAFDINHDLNEMKQAYMNKMDRYNHLSDKEKSSKIRQWIIQQVETTMPQIVVIDA
jgi:hypothetical protein